MQCAAGSSWCRPLPTLGALGRNVNHRMGKVARVVGVGLVGVSALATLQTVREIILAEVGDRRYTEEDLSARSLSFGGRTLTVLDDQPYRPTDPQHKEDEYGGTVRLLLDGHPLGMPSWARVRHGRNDLGRYHLWIDAWIFRERTSGTASLWVARRVQADSASEPRYEVTTVAEDGSVRRREVGGWQMSTDYRLYRTTQFITDGKWTAFPLALVDVLGFFPVLLLVFPIGTAVVGCWLLRLGVRKRSALAAVPRSI